MSQTFNPRDASATLPSLYSVTYTGPAVLPFGNYAIELDQLGGSTNFEVRVIAYSPGGVPSVAATATFDNGESTLNQMQLAPVDATRFFVWCGSTTEPLNAWLCSWDGTTLTIGTRYTVHATVTSHALTPGTVKKLSGERLFLIYQDSPGGPNTGGTLNYVVLGITGGTTLSQIVAPTTFYTLASGTVLIVYPDTTAPSMNNADWNAWEVNGDLVLGGGYGQVANGRQAVFHVDPTTSAVTVLTEAALTTPPIEQLVALDASHYLGLTAQQLTDLDTYHYDLLTWQVYHFDGTSLTAVGTPATWRTDAHSRSQQKETAFKSFAGTWAFINSQWSSDTTYTTQKLLFMQASVDASWNVSIAVQDITGQALDGLGHAAAVQDTQTYAYWGDSRVLINGGFADSTWSNETTWPIWFAAAVPPPDLEPAALLAAARPGAHLQARVVDLGGSYP